MITRKTAAPTLAKAGKDLRVAVREVKEAVAHEVGAMADRLAGKMTGKLAARLAAARKTVKAELGAAKRAARKVVKAKAGKVYAASSRQLAALQPGGAGVQASAPPVQAQAAKKATVRKAARAVKAAKAAEPEATSAKS